MRASVATGARRRSACQGQSTKGTSVGREAASSIRHLEGQRYRRSDPDASRTVRPIGQTGSTGCQSAEVATATTDDSRRATVYAWRGSISASVQ